MSAMGNNSQILILYATKSSSPYTPLIFWINKLDGSLFDTVEIKDPVIGSINPPSM